MLAGSERLGPGGSQIGGKLSERLSRKALYDLVWSEPLRTLSARFAISDVALKKTCAKAGIPTPERGYWAKKESGKKTLVVPLPERFPGMDDVVLIAGGVTYYGYLELKKEELLGALPPPPEFLTPIEDVRERIAQTIGKVTVPRDVRLWHPPIDRLLRDDDKRREKQLADPFPMSWDNPRFDGPFERRRLRLLNSLLVAIAKFNGKAPSTDREAQKIYLSFYRQQVIIKLEWSQPSSVRTGTAEGKKASNKPRLTLSILENSGSETERLKWQDDDDGGLEAHMTEAAIEVVLAAEVHYREGALRQYQWRVQRKAELEEEERRRKLEAKRAERERLKRLEQARIDRLLKDAAALQQARQIRAYVEAIRSAQSPSGLSSTEDLDRWSKWALAQADRIDPVIGGAFLSSMQEE
jgi:hypothetical protein